ncbi:MAG TPA: alpha/beta hydrolase [Solirubrobacteraceae bacterium]|nr:alpha/beta hydrolase [Solirubrobacteraceae bacterium]
MLAHSRTGHGPPIVLLHGIGLNRAVWDPVVPLLAREHEVIAVDLPGFGASPALDGTPSVEALAEAVESLGLERPHVAGNSLGGGIALELGRRGWAGSVCAISPIGFAAGRERAYARAFLTTVHAMASALHGHAELAYGGPGRRIALMGLSVARPWNVPAQAAARISDGIALAPGWDATLPAVTSWRPAMPGCATTIAWAEKDRLLLTGRQAPRARRWLPEARHVTLHGCGHVPMWDDPEQVAQAILDARA